MRHLLSTAVNFIPFVPYDYAGESVACDLCGDLGRLTVCRHDRRLKPLMSVACTTCGLVRTDPMPSDAELASYYAHGYRFDYQFSGKTPPKFHRVRAAREAMQRLAWLAPVMKPGGSLLDFGSGSGEFLAAAQAAGQRVLGLEPGRDYAAHARSSHHVDVIDAGWQEVDLPGGAFDLISAHHVLEHLRQPVEALCKLATWLKPDGVLYVSVPNVLAGNRATFERLHFAHVHNFTPQTLLWAGLIAGLEPDPRLTPESTTIAFRKRAGGPVRPDFPQGAGQAMVDALSGPGPWRQLLGGGFIVKAVRRWHKAARDSFAAAPASAAPARRGHRSSSRGSLASS
jgi:SAM-dependent methyltransferase